MVAVSSNYLVVVGRLDSQSGLVVEKQGPLASWNLWSILVLAEEPTIVYKDPIRILEALEVEAC